MGDAGPSELPPQPLTATNTLMKPADWHLVKFTQSMTQSRTDPQHVEHNGESTSEWSSVQHDFERRLNRFGITISEANSDSASSTSNKPTIQSRSGAHAIIEGCNYNAASRDSIPLTSRTKDFPPLETPTMASFTNNKTEAKLECIERQLRQAQAETNIWKEKCEAQERDLRVSYNETMEWRMKYEDLYSAVVQGREIQPPERRVKKGDTKSMG